MAMVQPKSQKLRLLTTHLLLLIFIAAIMFPLLMVIAISLREGNFATGSLIPENISWEHWKLALGLRLCPYAFPGQSNPAERDADFPDVPGGAVSGRVVCFV